MLSYWIDRDVVHMLCLQLGYAIKRYHHEGNMMQDTEHILLALDVFYRYCPDKSLDVLKLLPSICHINNNVTISLTTISIWHSCSSCSRGSLILLEHSATLPVINEILQQTRNGMCRDQSRMETILECLGLLKNLTYFGEDNRSYIAEQPNLITTITSLVDVLDIKARERLTAIFRNLVLSSDVRSQFSRRTDVLTAVVRLTGSESNNKKILRNILSFLTSLAMDSASIESLVLYGDGILIGRLKNLLVHDEDPTVRKRAARTLRLMARESSTIPSSTVPVTIILQDYEIIDMLSQRALNDSDDTVRVEIIEAFIQFTSLVRCSMSHYAAVLETLNQLVANINSFETSRGVLALDAVSRTFEEQARHPDNRKVMARHESLTTSLIQILLSSKSSFFAKENVCLTLVALSEEKENHEYVAIPSVLNTIVSILMGTAIQSEGESRRTRLKELVIHVLYNVAETPSTWKLMANQTALLQALLQYASANSTDPDLKKKVKAAILKIATEL